MLRAIVVMLACFVLMTDCECRAWAKSRPPFLVSVTTPTAFHCEACVKLEDYLRKSGVQMVTKPLKTAGQPVPWFPACTYSDGATDAGERVYEKRCNFRNPVVIYEWSEKETK